MSTKGRFAVLQPWTKVIETKVENPRNLKTDSIFQISNSPSHGPISMLNLAMLSFQMPKTLQTTLIWLQGGFFAENYIFYFVSAVLSKITGYWYFLKISPQTAHCYCNACWCTLCFQFNQFRLVKLICMNWCSYSAFKIWYFWRLSWILPHKIQKIVFTSLKTTADFWVVSKTLSPNLYFITWSQ